MSSAPSTTSRIPDPARRLLRKCLAKDAKQRLRDIGDARLLLEPIDNAEISPAPQRMVPAILALLACVLAPLVEGLTSIPLGKRHLPRWAAVITVYLGLAAALVLFFTAFVLGPILARMDRG